MTDRLTGNLVRMLLIFSATGVLLGGCNRIDATPINEVVTSPANFDGKEVMLHGVAKQRTRLPLFNMKSYVLKDESGEITILTEADLPRTDETLSVKVKVANLAIIKGEPLGTTVTEIERR